MLFSNFEWNVAYWPREYAAQAGNLVYFKGKPILPLMSTDSDPAKHLHNCEDHSFGGHIAGLDNPPALIADIRHIGNLYKRV